MAPASETDWSTEYGDLILSVAVVDSLEAAIEHITRYGSKHTESIVTEADDRARTFMTSLDAASLFHNASTRFSDGYRFGLGAEVGISTGKLHARGPVGLEGLTTYTWLLEGEGHVVGTYAGEDAKPFTHEEFDGSARRGSDRGAHRSAIAIGCSRPSAVVVMPAVQGRPRHTRSPPCRPGGRPMLLVAGVSPWSSAPVPRLEACRASAGSSDAPVAMQTTADRDIVVWRTRGSPLVLTVALVGIYSHSPRSPTVAR
ncbi:MAG: hypothetical protein U5K37_12180 [Natrialbaceae archaeon]|nr:hypothetical protein [Natrialbaceae archaeon]